MWRILFGHSGPAIGLAFIMAMSGHRRNGQPAPAPRLRLRVTATAETLVRGGHPWLFANSVREQNRPGMAGELAVIYDRRDQFLAVGLYDPDSPIRVRLLHAGKPVIIDEPWWRENLRVGFHQLP